MSDELATDMGIFDRLHRTGQSAFLALFAGARGTLTVFRNADGTERDPSFGKAECEWVPFRLFWQHQMPGYGWTTFEESEAKPALGMADGSTYTTVTIGVTERGAAVREEYWRRLNRACVAASVDRSPEGEKPQALSAKHESAVPERQTPPTEGDS